MTGQPPLARIKAKLSHHRWLVRAWGETLPLRRRVFGALRTDNIAFVHVGRCGSTVLYLMLREHPELYAHGELWWRYDRAVTGPWFDELDRVLHRAPYRRFWFASKLLGFQDLESIGTTMPEYFAALDRLRVNRFVGLARRNLLRREVSSLVAHTRDKWHTKTALATTTITLPVGPLVLPRRRRLGLLERLGQDAADTQALRRQVAARGGLWLVYEDDILGDPQRGYRRICQHLGIAPLPTGIPLERTITAPLSEVIANYDEVAAALEGTPYAWMLTAD